ncbi:MAG: hypothetical protein ACJ795_22635, partial [Ktedonobacteraceae bacterium]
NAQGRNPTETPGCQLGGSFSRCTLQQGRGEWVVAHIQHSSVLNERMLDVAAEQGVQHTESLRSTTPARSIDW